MTRVSFFPFGISMARQATDADALATWQTDAIPRQGEVVWAGYDWHVVHSVWWRSADNAACIVKPMTEDSQ